MTIKISQLSNSAITSETVFPSVSNIAGTLTTTISTAPEVQTYVLNGLDTDHGNLQTEVTTLTGNVALNTSSRYLAIASYANATPVTPTSTGAQGDIQYDATYIYMCVATNEWVRALRDTWV